MNGTYWRPCGCVPLLPGVFCLAQLGNSCLCKAKNSRKQLPKVAFNTLEYGTQELCSGELRYVPNNARPDPEHSVVLSPSRSGDRFSITR